MNNTIHDIADNVVNRFKQELSSGALQGLSAADFEKLAILVRSAIAKDRESTAAQIDTLAQRLKADIETFDIGL
ncbi:MAG: hypothetical protein LV471_12000 [Nitrosomonas sp.]|nr:hypothetical protein [Nitrosomonas sp.]